MTTIPTVTTYAVPELLQRQQSWLKRVWCWLAESRAHRVICLLGGLWLINIFDLILTLLAHKEGMLHEANPVANRILSHGPHAVCFYKVGLVGVGSSILIHYRRRLVAELSATALLLIYTFVAVQWKWCYEFYELSTTSKVHESEWSRVPAWTESLPAF